jgi:hypothetical protein
MYKILENLEGREDFGDIDVEVKIICISRTHIVGMKF